MTPLRILGKVPNSFTFALATGIGILLGLMFHTQLWTSHSLQRTSVTADKTSHSHWYKLWLQKYNLFQINENMNFSGQVRICYHLTKPFIEFIEINGFEDIRLMYPNTQ